MWQATLSDVSQGREVGCARTEPHVAVDLGRWSPNSSKCPFKNTQHLCDSCREAERTGRWLPAQMWV